MWKYYVEKEGKLHPATKEQIEAKGDDLVKVWEEDKESKSETPQIMKKSSPVDELTGLINELARSTSEGISKVNERIAQMEEQISAYKELSKKGFVPPANTEPADDVDAKIQKLVHWDMARQGQELISKAKKFNVDIKEEERQEMARYILLYLKANLPPSLGGHDPRAIEMLWDLYGSRAKTTIGDTGNVFPVPDVLERTILHFEREQSVLLQYANIYNMTSDKMSFPKETAGVSVSWGNTTQKSDPTIAELELDATELSAYTAVRNTQLADATADIVSWLTGLMAEAAGQELDNKGFNGLGTDDPFICSGILSAACGNSVVMGSTSTSFANIDGAVLSEMIGKLSGKIKSGARFWMEGSIIHYVRSLTDENGRPIFIETVGAPMSGRIWGYPYVEVVKMPSSSDDAASTAFVAFGNMKYFAVGRRLNTTSLQTDPYGEWTTNRIRFKIYQRWALSMALPDGFVRLLTAAS